MRTHTFILSGLLVSTFGVAACSSAETHYALTFEEPRHYDFGNRLFFGDVDGDGNVDAMSSPGSAPPAVKLGRGDGSFAPYESVGSSASVVALSDLNGDKRADIVDGYPLAVEYAQPGPSYSRGEAIRGSFVAVADVDGDGYPEIVSRNVNGATVATVVDGSGNVLKTITIANDSLDVQSIGDVNGDGKADFASGGTLLLSGPSGYAPSKIDLGSLEILSTVAGDLDRDGKADLVVTSKESGRDRYVITAMKGAGDGKFGAVSQMAIEEKMSAAPVLVDINGDGALDLALAMTTGVRFHFGDNKGAFALGGIELATDSPATQMVFVDVNHDGKKDLLASRPGSFDVFLNR